MFNLLFSFKGRISRATFWAFFLIYYGFFILLFYLADNGFLNPLRDTIRGVIMIDHVFYVVFIVMAVVFVMLCAYIQIPVIVKRLHDRNRSGANVLWYIIPSVLSGLSGLLGFVGVLYLIIFCGCLKGTPGPNDYGESPLYRI